jgi:apolipoprotein D and lipocalin family protein
VAFINICYASSVTAINNFEIQKYMGQWYEIARLPNQYERKCVAPINANYNLDPNDNSKVQIVNSCMHHNKMVKFNGVGHLAADHNVGKLIINFVPKFLRWTKIGDGNYWILAVKYDEFALVGSPDRKYLWILSRTDKLDINKLTKLIDIATQQGYATKKLIYNN